MSIRLVLFGFEFEARIVRRSPYNGYCGEVCWAFGPLTVLRWEAR